MQRVNTGGKGSMGDPIQHIYASAHSQGWSMLAVQETQSLERDHKHTRTLPADQFHRSGVPDTPPRPHSHVLLHPKASGPKSCLGSCMCHYDCDTAHAAVMNVDG
jgi:hypothetical protein